MTTNMDITHCDGLGTDGKLCPIRSMCRRHDYFKQIENRCGVKNYGQHSSFLSAPYCHVKGDCKMFWGDSADMIFHQLQNILGVKIKRVPLSKLKRKKIGYKLKLKKKIVSKLKEKALWLSLSKSKKKSVKKKR